MAASSSASSTELIMGDESGGFGSGALTPRLTRLSVSAAFDYRVSPTWTLSAGAGASVAGEMILGAERHQLDPGWLVVLAASRTLADVEPFFVTMGFSLGVSSVTTRSPNGDSDGRLTAGDFRWSLTVGRLFADVVAPYGVLRLFGGPVFWDRDNRPFAGGTDRYHVQSGLGLLLLPGADLDAFVEVAPVGERSASAGLGLSF